mgnify:CR=1 FL=1
MIKSKSEWSIGKAREYVKEGYAHCPICGSDEIEGGSVEIDGKICWQSVHCIDCMAEWDDIYELTFIEIRSFGKLESEVSLGGN